VVEIQVRRFICLNCHATTSVLPSFAQPYRLVCTATIHRHFCGIHQTVDTARWNPLLTRYRRRFQGWYPELAKVIGDKLGLSPPGGASDVAWGSLMRICGGSDLRSATRNLVKDFKITVFGRYRCHQ
jgi:hypothetical protein